MTPTQVSTSPSVNVDLWGVGNFPIATTPVDYHTYADNGSGNPNPTLTDSELVVNYMTKANAADGTAQVTPTGPGNSLEAYLQAFYTANPSYDASVTQQYAFLRLNTDIASASTQNRYKVDTAEAVTSPPVLSLDEVSAPEPASLSLLALGAGGLIARRRRRQ